MIQTNVQKYHNFPLMVNSDINVMGMVCDDFFYPHKSYVLFKYILFFCNYYDIDKRRRKF